MKNKKKSAGSKTWNIDCRIDSGFDFALKVLDESEKEYPLSLKINFIKIAYSNTLEIMSKVQTNPEKYKIKTAMKILNRNLTMVSEKAKKIITSQDNDKNGEFTKILVATSEKYGFKDDTYIKSPVPINNSYDYVDINYLGIENEIHAAIEDNHLLNDLESKYVTVYQYPKIYEHIIDSTGHPFAITSSIMPTNDIVLQIPMLTYSIIHAVLDLSDYYRSIIYTKHQEYVKYILDEGSKYTADNIPNSMLLNIPKDSFKNIDSIVACASNQYDKVKEIYITLYRIGKNSELIDSIINATKNDIYCKVYIELMARGEVLNDLMHIQRLVNESNLEYLDIKLHYNGVKVHGKMIYIGFVNENKPSIGIFSTGNYNEETAKIYKDYHYISCDLGVTDMIKRNFGVLWNSDQPVLNSISSILIKEISNELLKGANGRIWIQTNHLDNKYIVNLLKEADVRKCDKRLIVRTTKGFHNKDLKNCKTVVGKYLEHARVYIFGKDNDTRIYLSSSDILFRNLYNRFEAYVKINDESIKQQLIKDFDNLYKNGQKEI